ncbi:MAG: oligosaccharide flippase family protein, partial [candidate division WOR-3 bacterium]
MSRFFGFLTAATLARRLGVDGFGQIGFASAVLTYGVILTDFGLLTVGTRAVASDPREASKTLGRILPIRLILGLASALFIVVFAVVLPRPVGVRSLLAVYAGAVVAQALLLEWFFFGSEQMGVVASARILMHLSYYVLVLLLVRGPQDILSVPFGFIGSTLLAVLLLFISYRSRFGRPSLRFVRAEWVNVIRQAWPIGAAGVFTQMHVNFGPVGLGLLRSDSETGLYSAAFRLVFFLLALDRVFHTVFFPVVSRIWVNRPDRVSELIGTALRLILVVSLPLSTGLALLARPTLAAVFGPNYVTAASALRLLVPFVPVSMLSSMAGY